MIRRNRRDPLRRLALALPLIAWAVAAPAQGTGVALGGFGYQQGEPVQITADSLDVNQSDGTAVFDGHVIIGQGQMRMSAGKVVVEYGAGADGKNEIKRLLASGGVTLVSASEQAEAQSAVYTVTSGEIMLSGQVLVTQGATALSGDRMTVNLSTGQGKVEGNVRTILNTQGTKKN